MLESQVAAGRLVLHPGRDGQKQVHASPLGLGQDVCDVVVWRTAKSMLKDCVGRTQTSDPVSWQSAEIRPKDADHLKRPHVNLTGMIIHGRGTYVFLADECQGGGANWHIECLMRGLDMAWQRDQRTGWRDWLDKVMFYARLLV